MKNKIHIKIFLIIFMLFGASCAKEDIKSDPNLTANLKAEKDSNIVTIRDAELFAKDIFKRSSNEHAKTTNKSIVGLIPIGTDTKQPSFYIINYKNAGFLILSGDKRTFPVLAYSLNNSFDIKEKEYPDLLVQWLESTDEYIQKVRSENLADGSVFYGQWNREEISNFIFDKNKSRSNHSKVNGNNQKRNVTTSNNTDSSCESEPFGKPKLIATKGPLLSTQWGQGNGYNNLSPNYGCTKYSNGRTPTGCTATAMAQIMRYYQFPNSYNWSIMPDGIDNTTSLGANEISRLMKDSGDAVGMDWGCDGSSSESDHIDGALKSAFGYSSAKYSDFDLTTVHNELNNGYPVILSGGKKKKKWLIFNVYEKGHAWVCDGMESYKVKVKHPVGRFGFDISCFSRYTYHMNWGWDGMYDGWYSSMENPAGSFHYKAAMIYNIRK